MVRLTDCLNMTKAVDWVVKQLMAIPEKNQFPQTPTTHVIRKFLHQLPIEFNLPKAQWCEIPHPLPRIGETSGSTRKMHFIL